MACGPARRPMASGCCSSPPPGPVEAWDEEAVPVTLVLREGVTLSGLVSGRVRLRVEKFGHPMRDVEVEVPASNLELMLEGPGVDLP